MDNFNPLHREGGDTAISVYSLYPFGISIHSTARVETNSATMMEIGTM